MRIWLLGSGSEGNAVLLESGSTRVLVDAGFPARTLQRRLLSAGIAPQSIEAVVVTHEHTDHVCGIAASARRWRWIVHASTGTVTVCAALTRAKARPFDVGTTVAIGDFQFQMIGTSHDAEQPVAVVATSCASGARVGVAYDMGMATDQVRHAMRDLDLLVLESNYDEAMLRLGPYPATLKRRIASRHGHLSNRVAAALAREWAHRGLREVILAHLSETNNDPAIALRTACAALVRTSFRGRVTAATQHHVLGPISAAAGARRTEQLSLF